VRSGIAVEAADHEELLELLRRLRQRVEFAGVKPRWHEEIARASGDARGQIGVWNSWKPTSTSGGEWRRSPLRVSMIAGAASSGAGREAVFEPRLLRRVVLGEDIHGSGLAGTEQFVRGDIEFPHARGEIRIHRALGSRAHCLDADDGLLRQMRDVFWNGAVGGMNDLP